MNLALITAAGKGTRINGDIPKQFVDVCGMPVIVYTLLAFQRSSDIDAICIVVLDGWQDTVREYADKYGVSKPLHIVTGGPTGQDSITLGLAQLRCLYSDDDVVLIHDGVRPLVSVTMISDCIQTVAAHGNAIAAIPCQEAIMKVDASGRGSTEAIVRETLRRTQTPHGFYLGDAVRLYDEASALGMKNAVAACTIMAAMGRRVYFYDGAEKNIKITTPEDFDIFRAFLGMEQ